MIALADQLDVWATVGAITILGVALLFGGVWSLLNLNRQYQAQIQGQLEAQDNQGEDEIAFLERDDD